MPSPYFTLQVSRHAEPEVIAAAYRTLARKYHPDKNSSYGSTKRMQEINSAYAILKDPLKRRDYDRAHPIHASYYQPQSGESIDWSSPRDPDDSADWARSYSRRRTHPVHVSRPGFLRRNWGCLLYILLGLFAFYQTLVTVAGKPLPLPLKTSTPTAGLPAGCIRWTDAGQFDGQEKCVIGRIVKVDYKVDDLTGSGMWTAHFSLDPENDFSLISVGTDLSDWDGQCVIASGTLMDREDVREYLTNPQPTMVDSDPLDERGLLITYARTELCG